MNFPYRKGFRLQTLYEWIDLAKPQSIGMTDSQYAWYTLLMGENKREVNGVPVTFVDAPRDVVQ